MSVIGLLYFLPYGKLCGNIEIQKIAKGIVVLGQTEKELERFTNTRELGSPGAGKLY